MNATCLDLKELFGETYRLDVDESYYAERPEFRHQEEPWLTHIICRHGHIGVWGGNLLFASTNTRGTMAKQLKALRCVQVVQDGSDGVNVTFDLKDFDKVARVMAPKRRRRLSPEHRQRLLEVGAKYRFQPGVRVDSEAQICDGEGRRV